MNVTRDEAAKALGEIGRASDRIVRLKGYHDGAPHFIVWGLVWLVANTVTQFWPEYSKFVWPGGVAAGAIASTVLGYAQTRHAKPGGRADSTKRINWRIGLTWLVYMGFITCLFLIVQPGSAREGNAAVSIFFPFIYMGVGIWLGWRLFAIGLVTAAAIMGGFFWVHDYFDLWMGVFAGGALIAAGLWLRSA